MSALNPKVSLLIKLAEIAIAVNAEHDDEVTAWLDRMAELEYVPQNDGVKSSAATVYVKGPVQVMFSCKHFETLEFLETTQRYLDFISTGPCRECWLNKKLLRDSPVYFQPSALSLED